MGGGQHHHRRSRGPADSAKTESCQSRGDRRISFEQNRTVMQILTLTPQTEERLLARRAQDAAETHAIAAKIIEDVRRNRDDALFAYAKKFDHTDLRRTGVWITQKEIRVAQKATSAGFRKAIEKAAENVRTVAEKQLPRPWTVETSPGVKIHQVARPIESIGCYVPLGQFSRVPPRQWSSRSKAMRGGSQPTCWPRRNTPRTPQASSSPPRTAWLAKFSERSRISLRNYLAPWPAARRKAQAQSLSRNRWIRLANSSTDLPPNISASPKMPRPLFRRFTPPELCFSDPGERNRSGITLREAITSFRPAAGRAGAADFPPLTL